MIISTREVTTMGKPRMAGTPTKKSKPLEFLITELTHKVVKNPYKRGYFGAKTDKEHLVLILQVGGMVEGLRAYFSHRLPFCRLTHQVLYKNGQEWVKDTYEQKTTDFVYVDEHGSVHVKPRVGERLPLMAMVSHRVGKSGYPYLQLSIVRVRKEQ